MKRKLLSALLVCAMLLTLLPTALAVEPGDRLEGLIVDVSFEYKEPAVAFRTGEYETYKTLRNVAVVRIQQDQTLLEDSDDTATGKYDFSFKIGEEEFQTAETVHYANKTWWDKPGRTNIAYFEVPVASLTSDSGAGALTVRLTEKGTGNYDEMSVDLVKLALKDTNGADLTGSEFAPEDVGKVPHLDSGEYFVFFKGGIAYPDLPQLSDKADHSGQFVGWREAPEKESPKYLEKIPAADASIYATFGIRAVTQFVVTDKKPTGADVTFPEKVTDFETSVNYGETAEPILIYVVNTGNRTVGDTTDKGFYWRSSTGRFDVTYDAASSTADRVTLNASNNSYALQAGVGQNEVPDPAKVSYLALKCTPKADLPVGEYVDTLGLDNPQRLITLLSIKVTVNKAQVTVSMPTIEKYYGQQITLDQDGRWSKDDGSQTDAPTVTMAGKTGPAFSLLAPVITSDGFPARAPVDGSDYDYRLVSQTNANYNVELTGSGKVKVLPTKPDGDAGVTATAVRQGNSLDQSVLNGAFINPYNRERVEGALKWNTPEDTTFSQSVNEDGVDCQWTFTPTDNVNYTTVTGQTKVKVLDKIPTTIHVNTNQYPTTVTYDKKPHQLAFTMSYTDEAGKQEPMEAALTTRYKLHQGSAGEGHDASGDWQEGWPTDVGVWDIRAEYAGDDTYAPASLVEHLTIQPREVTLTAAATSKTYDGAADATAITTVAVGHVIQGDTVTVERGNYTASFNDANVGRAKAVTVTVSALSGADAGNYTLPAEGRAHTSGTIEQAPLTLKLKGGERLSKRYGETYLFQRDSFEAEGLKGSDDISALTLTFSSPGEGSAAAANETGYPVTAALTGGNYALTSSTVAGANLVVEKAALQKLGDPSATSGYQNGPKSAVQIIPGRVVNAGNQAMEVAGTWSLSDAQGTFAADATQEDLRWTFVPEDQNNYTGTLEGQLTVQVMREKPVTITVPDSLLNRPYDGQVFYLDEQVERQITTEPEAQVTVTCHQTIQNAGTYQLTVTATPIEAHDVEYGVTTQNYTLTVSKAQVTVPTPEFTALEGTPLSQLPAPEFLGVDGAPLEGSFQWSDPGNRVTELEAEYSWTFMPQDTVNYESPVTGSFAVTMAEDSRKVQLDGLYNLPDPEYPDYAVVDLEASGLKPGDAFRFYADADCATPISQIATVFAESGNMEVELESGALLDAGGQIYAKLEGRRTVPSDPMAYLPELDFTLPNQMVLLHTHKNEETVTVTVSDPSYKMTAQSWTPAGNGTEYVEVTSQDTLGSATLKGKAAGTSTITVSITFAHPDATGHPGQTITIRKDLPLNISDKFVVFAGDAVKGGTILSVNGEDPAATEASPDTTVTVVLQADSGYQIGGLQVHKKAADGSKGEEVAVTDGGQGSFTFTMPAEDVLLTPAFSLDSALNAVQPEDDGSVTVTVKAGVPGAVLCGLYDENGKLLALVSQTVEAGEQTLELGGALPMDQAAAVKVFLLDNDSAPQCQAGSWTE